jgi:hypothetical protein
MLIRNVITLGIYTLFLVILPAHAGNPLANMDPNLSQEELLEQFMSEINQLIPEAERQTFWEEVARETERLERETAHMSEEEKERYLMNIITQPPTPEAAPAPTPAPTPVPVVEEVKKPTVKPIAAADKVTEVVNIINSIVKSIESLLNKAAALPDFDGKIERWIRLKRINDWPAGVSWATFQHELNRFVHILQQIKEKDIKIGYKHIESIIEAEPVLNNLRQLETRLALNVPNIEVSVFAMAKMTSASKVAISKSINALAESMYKLQLPTELKKLMEKFEPIAKKIREEEEKIAKAAATPYARAQTNVPVKVAGKHEQPRRLPSLDDFGVGARGGYGGGGYTPPAGKEEAPAAKEARGGATAGAKRGGGGGGGSAAGKGAGRTVGGDGKGKEEAGRETARGGKGAPARRAEPKKVEQDPDVKRNLADFGKNMQDAANAIDLGADSYSEDALRRHFKS